MKETLHAFWAGAEHLLFDGDTLQLYQLPPRMAKDFSNWEAETALVETPGSELVERVQALHGAMEKWRVLSSSAMDRETKQSRERRVTSLWMNISHRCNLHCRYCFADHGTYGGSAADMDELVARQAVRFVLKQDHEAPDLRLVYFGGEPMMNLEVMREVVECADRLGDEKGISFSNHLITNGTIMSRSAARFLKKWGIGVQLSIDGPEQIHDRLRPNSRGKGSFHRIQRTVEVLREAGINDISIRTTVTRLNCHVAQLYRFLRELGFVKIEMVPVQGQPKLGFSLRQKDLQMIKKGLSELAAEIIADVRDGRDTELGPFTRLVLMLLRQEKKSYFCGAGYESVAVTPKGEIAPCHRLVSHEDLAMGDVWKGFRIGDGAESFKARTVDEKEQCRVCWAKYLCGGGCVADAYEITGSFDEVDVVHCEFTKAVAENALIIFHAISSSGVDAPTESPLREDIGCHPTSP